MTPANGVPSRSPDYPVFAYNATKLSPTEVASTFVPPDTFKRLRDARNAALVGPRGSGKTTLLKMLTPEGLSAWQGHDADVARSRVQDVGVFVGVDELWSRQLSAVESRSSDALDHAGYALHIAMAFVDAIRFRAGTSAASRRYGHRHLGLSLTREGEAAIAERASVLFGLRRNTSSLNGLRDALGDQLATLGGPTRSESASSPEDVASRFQPLTAVSELARTVNEVAEEPDRKWALLFDELEIAPPTIAMDVRSRLRGNEPLLVYKISLAPVLRSMSGFVGASGATHGQDIEFIPLTTPGRSEQFVADIFDRQRRANHLPHNVSPAALLGPSVFDQGPSDRQRRVDPYSPRGPVGTALAELRDNDKTFAEYLTSRNLDLNSIERLSPTERAAKLRKIRNLALVRAHFRARNHRVDSDPTRALYTGEATMMALPDGNPRMSMILVRSLLSEFIDSRVAFEAADERSDSRNRTRARTIELPRKQQARAVDETSTRFMSLVRAQTGYVEHGVAYTLVDLIDAIGNAFYRRIVDEPFSADVPAGFVVDDKIPDRVEDLLRQGVYTGALIHLPKRGAELPISESTRGRRYRLNNLLAPRYGLPIRQGKTVALSGLLESTQNRLGRRISDEAQPALLSLEEFDA